MLGVSRLNDSGAARVAAVLDVERGATLLFFTDGLTDSIDDALDVSAASHRLAEIAAAAPVEASPAQLVATLVAQTRVGRPDDVVVVAVRID